jgi:UDP-glucose 4-epimerase
MRENILVTGGAGFIGSHVVDKLIEINKIPIVVDNLSSSKIENLDPRALFYQQDITDETMMEKIFSLHKPRYIFHLAAQISVSRSVREPIFDMDVNIRGTLNLLKLAVENGAEKIIFSSTGGAIYGDDVCKIPTDETEFPKPISPYGIAKYSAENYLRFFSHEFGLKYTVLRYANVYGPKQDPNGEAGVVAIFSKKMLKNDEVKIFGSGECIRDYIYVDDIAEANLKAMKDDSDQIYNIGTSKGTSVNELFAILSEITSYKKDAIYEPPRSGDLEKSILNCEKAKTNLNWNSTVELKDGLKKTVEFFENELDTAE